MKRENRTEPAAGGNDEERGHAAVPSQASLARSSSCLSLAFGESDEVKASVDRALATR